MEPIYDIFLRRSLKQFGDNSSRGGGCLSQKRKLAKETKAKRKVKKVPISND
jgi:hypothetical protein